MPSLTIAFHGLAKISTFKHRKPFKFDCFVNYSHFEAKIYIKIPQKLVRQSRKLVGQNAKLVGHPPHQLYRKLRP